MPTIVVYTRQSNAEIRALVATLPGILAGRLPDPFGMRVGLQLRTAIAFLSLVKADFIVKARGGIGAGGIQWPPLSREYLAYGRGPKSSRTAGGLAPGGKDGFMSPADLARWRAMFRARYLKLAQEAGPEAARAALQPGKALDKAMAAGAARGAWADAKRRGVKTKLEVFGDRPHEILRDRGILFNSLSPGIVGGDGPGATYSGPGGPGGSEQVVRANPGELIVGTSVAYAAAHHAAKNPRRKRPLWPPTLPPDWAASIAKTAARGLTRAIQAALRA